MNIKNYLDLSIENKYKSLIIIEYLIKNFQFIVKQDNVMNDIRTMIIKNRYGEITICTTIVHKKNAYMELTEYIEIYYNNLFYNFNAD
jgi:hypothetical protein